VFAVLVLILRGDLLNIKFKCRNRDTLEVKLFQELFINFMRINLVKWHGKFETFIHAQLELPPSLYHSLLMFLDLSLILDNLSGIRNLLKRIPIPAVEEEHARLLEQTELLGIVIIELEFIHDLMHLLLVLLGLLALPPRHLLHETVLPLLVSELLRRLARHLLVPAHVAGAAQVHTRLLHATTALKQLARWFEGLPGFLLVKLSVQVLDSLEARLHIGDEGLGEFKFHRVVGEGALFTKLGDRFGVGGGPPRADIMWALVL
jgi:hypothetical protein